LNLYLRGGLATRASRLVQSHPQLLGNKDVIDRVSSALLAGEFYEQASELFERTGQDERALEGYRKAGAYARAVELSRRSFPDEVIRLEDEWGDKLADEKQLDAAINHYIEAGKTMKALEAAIGARQWKKAVQIVQVVDDDGSGELGKHFFRLGQHYESIKEYAMAHRFYMQVLYVQHPTLELVSSKTLI